MFFKQHLHLKKKYIQLGTLPKSIFFCVDVLH